MAGDFKVTNGKNKKKLRITCVLPVYWPAIGGCELHTHELVKRLSRTHHLKVITLIDNQEDKLAHELWVACILKAPTNLIVYKDHHSTVIKLALKPREKILNLPLARIQSPKLPDVIVRLAMERLSSFYSEKLIKLIKGSDILHCVHGGVSYLGYASLKAAKNLGLPFVYTPVLHLYHKNWLKEVKASRISRWPSVYNPQLHLIPRAWTDNFWYKLCCEADALITMTDFEKKFFVTKGISAEKVHKVGVAPLISKSSIVDFRRAYDLYDKKIVLFLGRNVENKGIGDLLKAAYIVWEKFPDTHFVFAGPKEGNSELIFQCYKDPRILVLGSISEKEKAGLLKACNVFCMPSREESLGGTFLEAWMFGKPIIGAKIPPLAELAENGKGGFLVNPVPEEIADKIMILLQKPDLANSMGIWGKKKVLDNYTWDIITQKVEKVYDNLLDTKEIG